MKKRHNKKTKLPCKNCLLTPVCLNKKISVLADECDLIKTYMRKRSICYAKWKNKQYYQAILILTRSNSIKIDYINVNKWRYGFA